MGTVTDWDGICDCTGNSDLVTDCNGTATTQGTVTALGIVTYLDGDRDRALISKGLHGRPRRGP